MSVSHGMIATTLLRLFSFESSPWGPFEYLPPAQSVDNTGALPADSVTGSDVEVDLAPAGWSFESFLNRLETYMDAASLQTRGLYGHSIFLDSARWNGIRKLTTYVPFDDDTAHGFAYGFADSIGWPAYGSVSMSGVDTFGTSENCLSTVSFVRHSKLPWYVRGPDGIPYEVVCVGALTQRKDRWKLPYRHFVTMNPTTKQAQLCSVLNHKVEHIEVPRPRRGGATAQRRTIHKVTRVWEDFDTALHDPLERKEVAPTHQFFPWVLNVYAQRFFNPLIVVTKGDRRASFGVELATCKEFFSDRGITVENKKGRRAPIVHWVKAHEKHRAGRIIPTRMHLRGERQFTWRGYRVSVVMPGLNSPMSHPGGLSATEYAEDETTPAGSVSFASAAESFAKIDRGDSGMTLAQYRKRLAA